MASERLHLIVSGRVQGVGYRYFAQRTARQLGVTGWVRNRGDGKVEGEAQAEPAVLAQFLAALREGPPMGHVTQLATQPAAPVADEAGFVIQG
jgi:acylphosphatase